MILPDIEPVKQVKQANGSMKSEFLDIHITYLRTYASASNDALAEKLGVSLSTIKRKKKELRLTKNTRVQRERTEHKQQIKQTKQKVEHLASVVDEVNETKDTFLAILDSPTGKDLNGIPLKQKDKLTITALQNLDNPKILADTYCRYASSKEKGKQEALMEERIKKDAVKHYDARVRSHYNELKKTLHEDGCWYPQAKNDLLLVARCKIEYDDAVRDAIIHGEIVKDWRANGVEFETESEWSKRATRKRNALITAQQKLSSNLEKYKRISGTDDEGSTNLDKLINMVNKDDIDD